MSPQMEKRRRDRRTPKICVSVCIITFHQCLSYFETISDVRWGIMARWAARSSKGIDGPDAGGVTDCSRWSSPAKREGDTTGIKRGTR